MNENNLDEILIQKQHIAAKAKNIKTKVNKLN